MKLVTSHHLGYFETDTHRGLPEKQYDLHPCQITCWKNKDITIKNSGNVYRIKKVFPRLFLQAVWKLYIFYERKAFSEWQSVASDDDYHPPWNPVSEVYCYITFFVTFLSYTEVNKASVFAILIIYRDTELSHLYSFTRGCAEMLCFSFFILFALF